MNRRTNYRPTLRLVETPNGRHRPPLSPRAPLCAAAVAAIAIGVVVLYVVRDPGPLDSPDEGAQRNGLVIPAADATRAGEIGLPSEPIGRRPVLLIFDRQAPRERLAQLIAQLPRNAAVVLALPAGAARATRLEGALLAMDSSRKLAGAVGLPAPSDGGPPIGYAVIDDDALVRYRTLDPLYLDHADEIATMLGAVA